MPFKHDPMNFNRESVAKYLWNAHDAIDKQVNYFKNCVNTTMREYDSAIAHKVDTDYPTEVINKTIDLLQDEADRLIRMRNIIEAMDLQ